MIVSFDTEAQAFYLKLKDTKVVRTKEFTDEVFLDFDYKGDLVGVETLNPGTMVLKKIARKFHRPELSHINTAPLAKVMS